DVIIAADGERIHSRDGLRNFEGLQAIGSKVRLDIRRDGKPLQLTATLKEQPRAVDGVAVDPRLAGAGFSELPERLHQAGVSGILVASVAHGSRAATNGLREGDVVI